MLKNQMKKVVSVLLSSAIVFGFTGCLDFGGGKKAVIEAAGELAENMAAADASKLIKNSTLDKKSDEAVALTDLLSAEYSTDDEKVATVSEDGKLTAVAAGDTALNVSSGGCTFKAAVSVADPVVYYSSGSSSSSGKSSKSSKKKSSKKSNTGYFSSSDDEHF